MARKFLSVVFSSLLVVALSENLLAQPQNKRQKQQEEEQAVLPDDKRLLSLHRNFVKDAEKLAIEYERDRKFEKAMAVYGEILKLVPKYGPAKEKYNLLKQRERNAGSVQLQVDSTKDWQYTGVVVVKGKPVAIRAKGEWTFTLKAKLTPEGIPIPKELRDFNLGCLIGYIDTGDKQKDKPFAIGNGTEFVAEKSGRLYVRMHDSLFKDNDGEIDLEIRGTFEEVK